MQIRFYFHKTGVKEFRFVEELPGSFPVSGLKTLSILQPEVLMNHLLFEEPLKILQLFDMGQLPVNIGFFRNLDPGSILVRSAERIES